MNDENQLNNNDDFTNLSDEKKAELDRMTAELAQDGNIDAANSSEVATHSVESSELLDSTSEENQNIEAEIENVQAKNNDSGISDADISATQESIQHTGNDELDNILGDLQSRGDKSQVSIDDPNNNTQLDTTQFEGADAGAPFDVSNAVEPSQTEDIPSWLSEPVPLNEYEDSNLESGLGVNEASVVVTEGSSRPEIEIASEVANEEITLDENADFEIASEVANEEITLDENADFEIASEVANEDITFDENADFEIASEVANEDITFDEGVDFEIEDDVLNEHAAENDFDATIDSNGNVEAESVQTEPVNDEDSNSQLAAQIAAMMAAKGLHASNQEMPPQQMPAGQIIQGSSTSFMDTVRNTYGSISSLFSKSNSNRGKSESEVSFKEHMEKAASKDVGRLAKLQAEQSSLMSQAVELTNPASYKPEDEGKVMSLLEDIGKTSAIIESQSKRLSVSTSNMKEQGGELQKNNSLFGDTTSKLSEQLKDNVNEINNERLKEAVEKIAEMLKKIFKDLFGKRDQSSSPVIGA